jgi:hypothetical protein
VANFATEISYGVCHFFILSLTPFFIAEYPTYHKLRRSSVCSTAGNVQAISSSISIISYHITRALFWEVRDEEDKE